MTTTMTETTKLLSNASDNSGRIGSVLFNTDSDLGLNRVENPYRIRLDLDETQSIIRQVRYILNKLTPINLQKLTGDFIKLPINTQERLEAAIDIIFEKSINEQVYLTTYAKMCKFLSYIKVPSKTEPGKLINFRAILLNKCEKEFDSDHSQNINYEKLLAEAETQTDEKKKLEMREIAQEKLSRAKQRSLGNIRFIGELFKLGMLTEGIMNDCIDRLLKQESDEENLECLCMLLMVIGKELEMKNNMAKMKLYFDKLSRISNRKDKVSARIRFMIMDVIDLRKNRWVPRSREAIPNKPEDDQEHTRIEAAYSGGFNMRKNKAPNVSVAKSIKEVKAITNKNLPLGPGEGGFS